MSQQKQKQRGLSWWWFLQVLMMMMAWMATTSFASAASSASSSSSSSSSSSAMVSSPRNNSTSIINCNPCIDRESTRIKAIVHGTSNDVFWQQVQQSMIQAAQDMRIQLDLELYPPPVFDPNQMAKDIREAAASYPSEYQALIVTIPSQEIESAILDVRRGFSASSNVPIFGLNSGYEVAGSQKDLGILGFVSMDEYGGGAKAAEEFVSLLTSSSSPPSSIKQKQQQQEELVAGEEDSDAAKLSPLISSALFVNYERDNSANAARFQGFQDTLLRDNNSDVQVEEVILENLNDAQAALENKFEGCPYDAILIAGNKYIQPTLQALKAHNCRGGAGGGATTLLGTFDDANVFDAIAVGDLDFAISQQQHLQGTLSVVLASIYATTGKTLASSSETEFGAYVSGPAIVNLQNLPPDSMQHCVEESFPVCSSTGTTNEIVNLVKDHLRGNNNNNNNHHQVVMDEKDQADVALASAPSSCPCTERSKIRIGGVLHGVTVDKFWDVVFEQAYQAADDLGVDLLLDRLEPQPTTQIWHAKMASKMISLCQEGVDGLFVTIPSVRVLAAIKQCQALNVPVISINSGADMAKEIGLIHHISQLEYEAGYAAGERLLSQQQQQQTIITHAVCIKAEAGNVGVDERCQGFEDALNHNSNQNITFGSVVAAMDSAMMTARRVETFVHDLRGSNIDDDDSSTWEGVAILATGADIATCMNKLKEDHPGFIAGAFDLNDEVYKLLDDGTFLFAIDQNPFVQGYMPVWLLTLIASNKQHLGNTFIESGPRFVERPPSVALQQCNDNNFKVCDRPVEIVHVENLLPTGILAMGYIAVAVSWGLSLFSLGWMFLNREMSIVQASQPEFLTLICIGAMVSSSTLIAMSFQAGANDDVTMASNGCTAAPFLYSIGWVLIFSSLCAKTYRIFKIMQNASERKQEVVSFLPMLKIVVLALTMDMVIVVAWTVSNPLVYKREEVSRFVDPITGTITIESIGYCSNKDENGPGFWAFAGPLAGVHLALLIITNLLLYKVRKMKDRYQESKYISFAMLLMLETLVVGVPIAVAVGDPRAIYVILIGIIAVHDIAVLSLLFLPKVLFQSSAEDEKEYGKEDSMILASLIKVTNTKFGEAMAVLDEVVDEGTAGLTETQRVQLKLVKTMLIQRNSNDKMSHVPTNLRPERPSNNFILREFAGIDSSENGETASLVSRNSEATLLMGNDDVYTLPEFHSLGTESQRRHVFRLLSWSNLKRWDFSIFDLVSVTGGNPLLFVGWAILGSPYSQFAMAKACGCSDEVTIEDFQGYNFMDFSPKIPIKKLCDYMRAVEADYMEENPYHNAIHAADVVQSLHSLIQMSGNEFTVREELFSILLAAVVHDVKHPGKNNAFQVNAHSPLALVYNDSSVLENKHAAHAFMLMLQKPTDDLLDEEDDEMDLNLLSNVDRKKFADIRKKIVDAVLQTDMSGHFAKVDTIRGLLEDKAGIAMDARTRWSVLTYMLHLADISNPAKGDPLFKLWTDRCLEEFFAQGDVEAELGLPVSPNCDRKTTNKESSQIGFINFVIKPSYQVLGIAIPAVMEKIVPLIDSNLKYWEDQARLKEERQIVMKNQEVAQEGALEEEDSDSA